MRARQVCLHKQCAGASTDVGHALYSITGLTSPTQQGGERAYEIWVTTTVGDDSVVSKSEPLRIEWRDGKPLVDFVEALDRLPGGPNMGSLHPSRWTGASHCRNEPVSHRRRNRVLRGLRLVGGPYAGQPPAVAGVDTGGCGWRLGGLCPRLSALTTCPALESCASSGLAVTIYLYCIIAASQFVGLHGPHPQN